MSNRHDISLDLNVLMSIATAETGLDDFEDDALPERAERIVEGYRNLGLSADQQEIAAETILDILVTRLKLTGDRKLHPEITREKIEKPVVVVGFGRSGTTLLYSLMAADPGARSPHWWDALHPSPPVGLSPEHDHLRKQISQREVAEFLRVVPIKPAHNYFVNGADMSLECYMLWGLDFRSLAFFLYFRAHGFPFLDLGGSSSELSNYMSETYRFEKKLLQNLQWRRPTDHWVLKDPTHHYYLPEMNEVFPDATFIWPHRDPVSLFSSMVELSSAMISGMARNRIDRCAMAQALMHACRSGLDRVMKHPIIDAPNVIHVSYKEMTQDSVALGRKIYAQMGREFTPAIQKNIEDYRANPNNRSDLYGKFEYSLENTGFSADEIRECFKDYIEKFDLRAD